MSRAQTVGGGVIVLMCLAVWLQGQPRSGTATSHAQLLSLNEANWDDACPEGKEVDAIYGDYVLKNRHLTAVIAQPLPTRHANMTTKEVGAGLIDLVDGSGGNDQLTAYLPGRRNDKFASAEFSQSADGQTWTVVNALDEHGVTGASVALTMLAPGSKTRPAAKVTYKLGEHDLALTVETVYHNTGSDAVEVTLEDDFRVDGGKEELTRSPNGVADDFWLYDSFWGQAYGLAADGRKLQLTSDARTTQIKYVDANLDGSVTLQPGETVTLTRRIQPATDRLALAETAARRRQTPVVPCRMMLRDAAGRPLPRALCELSQGETLYGTAMSDGTGLVTAMLPAGTYRAAASRYGVRGEANVELVVPADVFQHDADLVIPALGVGRVVGAITDDAGRPLPCKLEFRPQGDLKLHLGPETAEYGVRNLRYAPLGQFEQELPPGMYEVRISHGPEYDLVKQPLEVRPQQDTPLAAKLVRSVNTSGWVSSDFHSHASPSGDNSSSQLGRVINLVCEHIEFAPCTEHNRVSTYDPHIKRLGIGAYMATVSGMELTGSPLPLNHQNAFPMVLKPRTQDGGGPQTATSFEEQIERLALWDDRSEKLIQVNHPDLGWMFYDRDGNQQPDAGHERAFPFMDVMEIHPVDNVLDLAPFVTLGGNTRFHNTIFRWLQLLNQGYRIAGVVNTDAHYNFHGSGPLRNWIQSPTDQPAEIQPLEMVHAAEQGRLVMSNGPFLEVWASETGRAEKVTSGQELAVPSKSVTLSVRVECPNWLDVDRVFVLVNGRIDPRHNYSRLDHPQRFHAGAVKFAETLTLTVDEDAHVIVATGDAGGTLGEVYGEAERKTQPAALTNPIFIDIDGNGFTANKDRLDADLPVKFAP
jgi:hypothetical protein